jgi:protein SCO1/2
MVLTPQGKVSRYLYGISFPPRDLRFTLEDASAGKIGSPVTYHLRLLWCGYDPATGTYTVAILRLVRLAGAVTVLSLGFFLWRAWRRERRAASALAAAVPLPRGEGGQTLGNATTPP